MQLEWTLKAIEDLEHIRIYIKKDNPAAASRVSQRIRAAIESLAANPHAGRTGRIFGTRELVIIKTPYIAALRIKNNKIQIVRIIHQARNWEEAMKEVEQKGSFNDE